MDGEQAALAVGILWVGAAEAARAARLREVCGQTKALITQEERRKIKIDEATRRQNTERSWRYGLGRTPLRATRVVVVAAAHNPAASMVVTDLVGPLVDVADHVQHT